MIIITADECYCIIVPDKLCICNVYLPCSGTSDRLDVCNDVLVNIGLYRERFPGNVCFVEGDFNSELNSSNTIFSCVNEFMSEPDLGCCDVTFYSSNVNKENVCK